jgi:mono/diheme cytochrome c family protein
MKVCAEYEDQISAFKAHRTLLEKGANPEEIELRSPYPLSEHAVPPHRSRPMVARNVVRLTWLFGIVAGFSFLTFTQLEWGLTAKTGGQPLVAVPINAIPMYECGMILAILMNTLMFFIETRRYRQLVPPLEEDMPVANGYIALVVSGEAANKAKEWLNDSGARSVVSYLLPILFMGTMLSGCATRNMRTQVAIKPLETAADLPPERSIRQPSLAEQAVTPPQPFGWLYDGDQIAYERAKATLDKVVKEGEEAVKAGSKTRPEANREAREARAAFAASAEDITPKLWLLKTNTVPAELRDYKNPVPRDEHSLARGEVLYKTNCAQCHGESGLGDGKVGAGLAVPPAKIGSPEYQNRGDGDFYHFIMTGKNLMPAFGYKLNTREIMDIINYLRKLQGAA